MYKIQMTFQKIACYLAVISGAIAFVYSLGIATDLYDAFYAAIRSPSDLDKAYVTGARIYYDIQNFNMALMAASLVMLLVTLLGFITQTHARRRYYIGNYVATGVISVGAVSLAIWSHLQVEIYKVQFLTTVDFEQLESMAAKRPAIHYITSTFWFDIHYLVGGLLILSAAALIGNMIWKISLMNAEKRLITTGKESAAA